MNKKIKSLVISGLIVMFMGTNVFALEKMEYEGNDGKGQCSHNVSDVNKLDSPTVGEHMLGEFVKITVSEDLKYAKVESLKDEYGYDYVKINAVHMKGGNGYNCYVFDAGETWASDLSCPLNNGGQIPEISHITVDYTIVPESERPIPEGKGEGEAEVPKDPTSGVTNPPSGDAMTLLPIVTVVASGALLYLNNKKNK